jgi:hypothetical protein
MIGTESKSKLLPTLERAGRQREGKERERERERERESIKRKQQKRKAETNGADSKGHGRTCNSGTKSDLCFHGLRRLERDRERAKENKTKHTNFFCDPS